MHTTESLKVSLKGFLWDTLLYFLEKPKRPEICNAASSALYHYKTWSGRGWFSSHGKIWIPRRGKSCPGLQPSTQESAHPSFFPSLHPIVWVLTPFQMLQLHQTECKQEWGAPTLHRPRVFFCSPHDVFLSASAFSEELCEFRQQFVLLRTGVACREDVIPARRF